MYFQMTCGIIDLSVPNTCLYHFPTPPTLPFPFSCNFGDLDLSFRFQFRSLKMPIKETYPLYEALLWN